MLDALGHAHGRPQALATVIGAHGGVEGGQCGVGIEQRGAAENHLIVAVLASEVHRAAHLGQGARPGLELAIDQVFALLGRPAETVLFRNVAGVGKQVAKDMFCGHVFTPCEAVQIHFRGYTPYWSDFLSLDVMLPRSFASTAHNRRCCG
ncbi:hypothetical protein D3C73_1159580 [compost metagenome]